MIKIRAIAAGGDFSLGLDLQGRVWGWGANGVGQLGSTSAELSRVPIRVGQLSDVLAISAAPNGHCLALKSDRTVWAWGLNASGQLGNGTRVNSVVPVQVQGLTQVKAVAAGAGFSLALKLDGSVWAWGTNDVGQLGNGQTGDSTTPTQVHGISSAIDIAAGNFHGLAAQDGTIFAWGNNSSGQIGDNVPGPHRTPAKVLDSATGTLTDVVAVQAGAAHSLALKADGTVRAWGFNGNGHLGIGSRQNQPTAVAVHNLQDIKSIESGVQHCLAIKTDGSVWGWGQNASGQVGNRETADVLEPVQISPTLPGGFGNLLASLLPKTYPFKGSAVAVSGGTAHSLALLKNGTVYAWGTKGFGQLGNGTDALRPLPAPVVDPSGVGILNGIDAISAGGGLSIAHEQGGRTFGWGVNLFGQVGDGTTQNRFRPVEMTLTGLASVATSGAHTLAVESVNREVLAWGLGTRGQLGGTPAPGQFAVRVPGLTGIDQVSGPSLSSLALDNGNVCAWGSNAFGELGTGSQAATNQVPAQVQNDPSVLLSNVTAISAGFNHVLARLTSGAVRSWGRNNLGQLGDGSGSFESKRRAVPVAGLPNVIDVKAGGNHSLALSANGAVFAWGLNDAGQLGVSGIDKTDVPMEISGLTNVTRIAGGGNHCLAILNDGTVWAWGANLAGQLGDGTHDSSFVPRQVRDQSDPTGFLTGIDAVAAGVEHSLALKAGMVYAWGSHAFGQAGDNSNPNQLTAQKVNMPP